MLATLLPIFLSRTKSQEILFLLRDAKLVVRQGFYPNELPPVEKFCTEHHLSLVKSKFKVLLDDTTETFSNKGIRIPEHDAREGLYFIYLSKDEKSALLASYYELTNNHRELGLLLGYPECCIDFFCQNFNVQQTNLELPPTNPYTNLSLRGKDSVLISHFPCNSDCEKSSALGRKYLSVLEKEEPARAEELRRILST